MPITEKLTAAYLRLNGFLVLSHFTTYVGQHNHIDLVGIRMPGSAEVVDGKTRLLTDDRLVKVIEDICRDCIDERPVGIVAEVRTNTQRDDPDKEHLSYVQQFLGGAEVVPISVFDMHYDEHLTLKRDGDQIIMSHDYVWDWILERIEWMNKVEGLNKSGSWCWSEDFLADILTLHAKGYLRRTTD